jgi:aminopeptidase N
MKDILEEESLNPSFRASLLNIPADNILMQHLDLINPERLYLAKKSFRSQVGNALLTSCQRLYSDLHQRNLDQDTSHTAITKRRLKNLCLSYIWATGSDLGAQMVEAQYYQSANMTDMDYALGLACASNHPTREEITEHFFDTWQQENLVINRWFAHQATSPREDSYEHMLRLLGHKDFSLNNPNRARSLLFMYFLSNHYRFHADYKRSYQLCAEYILRLDKSNPMLAARLARAFNLWKSFDNERQNAMKATLAQLLTKPLSNDVYEILARAQGF